ncbi:hypothetical protein [Sphingomonas colocasiae]|uniref:DUF4238 domain-containing protein n=1 Tax=Sphingomonas colocasiae TaxID=1848973 RepID=A0ABS7PSP0_9SPHN|nr:hypothetical protein [Sphingomonas colocasiae]MBY8824286.1 hypothetical protein [Sphingomonas colocasiae]
MMSGGNRSKDHHWWPVALQGYWANKHGNVSWIDPNAERGTKRYYNRKIGSKRHGHTMLKGKGVWETNFESEFDIDDKIHNIIAALKGLKPLGVSLKDARPILKLLLKKDRSIKDGCRLYHLDERLHRNLLLLLHSLLIRSPSFRSKYERFPMRFGLPQNEDIGKANMHQNYRLAKRLCTTGYISLHSFVLLHSPFKKFICGDGHLDWLTGGLTAMRIDGRALIPLTPHLCVYFCTLNSRRSSAPNCASLLAPPWMVDQANDIVQIYSGNRLFFLGKPPSLSPHFLRGQFLEHDNHRDPLIEALDEIAGNNRDRGFLAGF